jgi:hypothetical protein
MKKIVMCSVSLLFLIFAGCDNPTNSTPSGKLGEELVLENQQLSVASSIENGAYTYTDSKEDGAVKAVNTDEKADVVKGKFSLTITTPILEQISPLNVTILQGHFAFAGYSGITMDPPVVNYSELRLEFGDKHYVQQLINGNSSTGTEEEIHYFYVDQAVTVTLPGRSQTSMINYNYKGSKLVLETGWNAIYRKTKKDSSHSETSVSLGKPNLKWVPPLQNL